MMDEPLIDLSILLAFMVISYISWRIYRQYQEEKEKKADVNQQLFLLTQPTATTEEIMRISENLLLGINYSFKHWVNPEHLGQVHGRILAAKEVSVANNLYIETIIEDLAKRLKLFDIEYRRRYIVGLGKVKPKYAEIIVACL